MKKMGQEAKVYMKTTWMQGLPKNFHPFRYCILKDYLPKKEYKKKYDIVAIGMEGQPFKSRQNLVEVMKSFNSEYIQFPKTGGKRYDVWKKRDCKEWEAYMDIIHSSKIIFTCAANERGCDFRTWEALASDATVITSSSKNPSVANITLSYFDSMDKQSIKIVIAQVAESMFGDVILCKYNKSLQGSKYWIKELMEAINGKG